ncbi:MAG: ATP-binding protein [Halobacterium sp.]
MTGLVFAGYVGVFAVAALACFAGLTRVGRVDDPDTRRGLTGLLVASGLWAAAQAAFLVVPWRPLQVGVYTAGLVAGLSTVGSWLYFCSAYTGRTFHRDPTVRRAALGAFLAVVAVKVTNSLHGFYFVVEPATAPFPHLAVEHQVLHWLVMGVAYVLAGVGYFMLFEFLSQTGYDTRPLLALVAVTGLPVALDVLGGSTSYFLEITYESLGVAAFAVGVLSVYLERFQAVQLAGDIENAVVFLTEDDTVRDANDEARSLFPALADATGEPFADVVPEVADSLDGETVMECGVDGERRYFRVSSTPFTFGGTRVGRMVVITDVTREEQYRQQIERQNERLGQFASVVSHDLRNPLNVAQGRLALEREHRDSENLAAVSRALDRMDRLVSDVLFLAREGVDIGERTPVSLAAVAERAWASVAAGDATFIVDEDVTFAADDDRVVQLLENLYRNAIEHGDPDVTVRVGALDDRDGFYVEDDGPGIPEDERDDVFEMGWSSGGGTGIGLAIVQTIAEAHGWDVSVTDAVHDTDETPGARFEVTGVELAAA